MAHTHAWYSESGGVGKTTNAVHTSAAMHELGYDVCLVDCDPQRGGATHHLGHGDRQTTTEDPTLLDALFDHSVIDDILIERDRVDLVASHPALAGFSSRIARTRLKGMDQFTVLEDLLGKLIQRYDYDAVVVDVPTSLSGLVNNSLLATRDILVPVELTAEGQANHEELSNTIDAIIEGLNHRIQIKGLVPSKVQDISIQQRVGDQLQDSYPVLPTQIRQHSLFSECWDAQCDLFAFAGNNEYRQLRDYERSICDVYRDIAQYALGETALEELESTYNL